MFFYVPSLTQALADVADFIPFIKEKYGCGKVVTFGGSYSGALSAFFRTKYPHVADAAVATSAPVLAQLNFEQYVGACAVAETC